MHKNSTFTFPLKLQLSKPFSIPYLETYYLVKGI